LEIIKSGGIIPRIVAIGGVDVPPRSGILKLAKTLNVEDFRKQLFFPEDFEDFYKEPDLPFIWDGMVIKHSGDLNNRESVIKKMEHFVKLLKIKEFGESTLKVLYDEYNVTSIEKLVSFNYTMLVLAAGYGQKSAATMKNEMKTGMDAVQEHVMMAACGLIPKLGRRKLKIYLTEGADAKGLGDHALDTIKNSFKEWRLSMLVSLKL